MAGIDSQVVFRILEHFAKVYFSHDPNTFVSGTEAYEFTYLIIVLQTCQHNPSIKEKTTLERFLGQAKEIVPQSFATLPEGFVVDVFNKVTS
jgi:Sec7-like guanine-nucleotide exchange factor